MVDASERMMEIPNPLLPAGDDDRPFTVPQKKHVEVHTGFYDYLFSTKNADAADAAAAAGSSTTTIKSNKYQQILDHLYSLVETYPGYRILATGHSMGAALAMLYTFFAAATSDSRIPKPIICICFAPPRIGNIKLSRAFQELELQGKILNLRVVNDKDVIPQMPSRLSLTTVAFPGRIYRPIGMELRLYAKGGFSLVRSIKSNRYDDDGKGASAFRFPRIYRSRARIYIYDLGQLFIHTSVGLYTLVDGLCLCGAKDYVTYHSCQEYLDRLERASPGLEKTNLRQLRKEYCGNVANRATSISEKRSAQPSAGTPALVEKDTL